MSPSLEQLGYALQNNCYLIAVLARCQLCKAFGSRGVCCTDEDVAGYRAQDEENTEWLLRHINTLSKEDKLSIVPFLCRMGYNVLVFPHEFVSFPFSVDLLGSQSLKAVLSYERSACECKYYRSTAPGAQRLRGVMWCVPRLLRWKHRALQFFQGSLSSLLAEGVGAHVALPL